MNHARVLTAVACGLLAAGALAFDTEPHRAIHRQGNVAPGLWSNDENDALDKYNYWVDNGCGNGFAPWCPAEWHADDDTVVLRTGGATGLNARQLMDRAWSNSVIASPSDKRIRVKAAIDDLWAKVVVEKNNHCQPTKAGCLKRKYLDKLDVQVRESVGVRSHTTHDFYSHSTYVEASNCAAPTAYTRNPSTAFPAGAARFANAPQKDTVLRSGWWVSEFETVQRWSSGRPKPGVYNTFTVEGQGGAVAGGAPPFTVTVPGLHGGAAIYLHDGVTAGLPAGAAQIHGLNKDKDWACAYPCAGGGFCTGAANANHVAARTAAIDTQAEENRRLCNTIKDVVLTGGGNAADVMAVWFYVTGTERCGCKPLVANQVYWSK
jgi:hypothetical protein